MITIPKIVGVSSCALVLCISLSYAYAAHPKAETSPSDNRGSQGNQEMMRGDSTPRKGDEKVDETKVKEDTKKAKHEFDNRNARGQEEMGEKNQVPLRTLQTNYIEAHGEDGVYRPDTQGRPGTARSTLSLFSEQAETLPHRRHDMEPVGPLDVEPPQVEGERQEPGARSDKPNQLYSF